MSSVIVALCLIQEMNMHITSIMTEIGTNVSVNPIPLLWALMSL